MIVYLSNIHVQLNGSSIYHSNQVRYLGCLISSKLRYHKMIIDDIPEIKSRICELYRNANIIKSRFSHCSQLVKRNLFLSYFSSIYCCSLWLNVITKSHSARVAHNDALRIIFGIPRFSSASDAFVANRIGNIDYVLRTAMYSLKQRICATDNILLSTIDNKDLSAIWNSYLYVN